MIPSGIKAYQTTDPLSLAQDAGVRSSRTRQTDTTSATTPKTTKSAGTSSGDRVTLSPEVALARLRDELGLTPSGNISKDQLEEARIASASNVNNALTRHMESVGIPTDRPLTLTSGSKGTIRVEGSDRAARQLETALNKDEAFKKGFEAATTHIKLDRWVRLNGGAFETGLSDQTSRASVLSTARNYTTQSQDGIPFQRALSGIEADTEAAPFIRPEGLGLIA